MTSKYQIDNRLLAVYLFSVLTLVIIGLIFIYSSSSVYAMEKFGTAHYFVKKQLIGLIIGALGFTFCRFFPVNLIQKFTPIGFLGSILLTAIPIISNIGVTIHGSKRWIYIKGLSFQPSELLKVATVMYISYLIAKKEYRVKSLINGFIPLLCIIGITSFILLKQPDFGQTITLSLTTFMLFFVARCQLKHILYTSSFFVPIFSALIYIKPYRIKRVLTFLNPWSDPKGSGFQIIQSLIAIGSGHINGVGIAQSKQKFFYLPMQHTDFIFSIIAEEMGFIGSLVIISLYVLFLYTGIKIAQNLNDPFAHYTTLGFTLLVSLQALINLFVATGLMPTKGLGLPFISYGNSALICNLCMIGIITNFAHNNKQVESGYFAYQATI